MNSRINLVLGALLLLSVAGCGSSDSSKPSSAQEVTEFKGNPSSPATRNALQSHFGGPPPGGGQPPAPAK